MENFKLIILSFIFSLCVSSHFKAQSMYLNLNNENGTISSYALDDIQKITFNETLMKIHLKDGSELSTGLNAIEMFRYSSSPLEVNDLLNKYNKIEFVIFPNPVSEMLNVKFQNIEESSFSILLYNLKGELLMEKKYNALNKDVSELIDLKNIDQGTYHLKLRLKNQEIVKSFVKK